jgi:hypothetical protein
MKSNRTASSPFWPSDFRQHQFLKLLPRLSKGDRSYAIDRTTAKQEVESMSALMCNTDPEDEWKV